MGMDFNNTQPIWMQIVDGIFEQILSDKLKTGEKAKSVRELAVAYEVNPNTVMRSYDYLQNNGIFTNKRGIGFFVAYNAKEKVLEIRRKRFLEEEVPIFIKTMKMLGIDFNELSLSYFKSEV